MSLTRIASRLFTGSLPAGLLLATCTFAARPDAPGGPPATSPWGVSSSASSFRDHAEWFPKMAAAGVTTRPPVPRMAELRAEERDLEVGRRRRAREDRRGQQDRDQRHPDGVAAGRQEPPTPSRWTTWTAGPTTSRPSWAATRSRSATGKSGTKATAASTTASTRRPITPKLAVATYAAAKKADPHAQVGLTVASFDAPYLNQTIRAMAKAGKPNSFDYLCIHPYEIADGLADVDGEIPFLWMTRLLRDVLKVSAPDRADAEIWITEVGRRIEKRKGRVVTEAGRRQGARQDLHDGPRPGHRAHAVVRGPRPGRRRPGIRPARAATAAPAASYKTLKTLTTHSRPDAEVPGLAGAGPGRQGLWVRLPGQGRSRAGRLDAGRADGQDAHVRGRRGSDSTRASGSRDDAQGRPVAWS